MSLQPDRSAEAPRQPSQEENDATLFHALGEIIIADPDDILWQLDRATRFPQTARGELDTVIATPSSGIVQRKALKSARVVLDVVESGLKDRIAIPREEEHALSLLPYYRRAQQPVNRYPNERVYMDSFRTQVLGLFAGRQLLIERGAKVLKPEILKSREVK